MIKKLTLILIFTITILSILPIVSAVDITIDSSDGNDSTNPNYRIQAVHPSVSNDISAFGEVFNATETGYLTEITVDLKRNLNPTGYLQCILTGVGGGTQGTNAFPDTSIDASSDLINCQDIQGTFSSFTFTFDGTYELNQNDTYAFYIKGYNATFTSTDLIYADVYINIDNSNNVFYYKNGAWNGENGLDLQYIVLGNTVASGATPTPTPIASNAPTDDFWSGALGTTLSNALNLIAPLIFALIPAFFGYKFAKAWGFFAGINLGIILCYLFIAGFPIWAVIVMLILDGLLLFGRVGIHD